MDFQGLNKYNQEVMIGYSNKDIIFHGWQFSPKRPKQMSPNLRKIYTSDGDNIQTYLHGTKFVF